jgi:PIN domain nuclease of toxin-antitoxin system
MDAPRAQALAASADLLWELALLVARETVVLPLPIHDWVPLALSRPDIRLIGLTRPTTVIDSVHLPGEIRGDPADRFLIATARSRRAKLATHDEKIIAYGRAGHVKVLEV